jgi:single-strand DNA-binding protein
VVVWRDQAEHAAESLHRGSRVVVVSRLQHRAWTAEDGSARSLVEVAADELGPSLRWATAITSHVDQQDDASGRDAMAEKKEHASVSLRLSVLSRWL